MLSLKPGAGGDWLLWLRRNFRPTWCEPKLPPGTLIYLRRQHGPGLLAALLFRLASFFQLIMAANNTNLDEFLSAEYLEEAVCVLAGSDPDNCSYSQVCGFL